jgi:hypothetical protein
MFLSSCLCGFITNSFKKITNNLTEKLLIVPCPALIALKKVFILFFVKSSNKISQEFNQKSPFPSLYGKKNSRFFP